MKTKPELMVPLLLPISQCHALTQRINTQIERGNEVNVGLRNHIYEQMEKAKKDDK